MHVFYAYQKTRSSKCWPQRCPSSGRLARQLFWSWRRTNSSSQRPSSNSRPLKLSSTTLSPKCGVSRPTLTTWMRSWRGSGVELTIPPSCFLKPGQHVFLPAPVPNRVFCDNCDVFGHHETQDCPVGTIPGGVRHGGPRSLSGRSYCTVCEMFGHTADQCEDDMTFWCRGHYLVNI